MSPKILRMRRFAVPCAVRERTGFFELGALVALEEKCLFILDGEREKARSRD